MGTKDSGDRLSGVERNAKIAARQIGEEVEILLEKWEVVPETATYGLGLCRSRESLGEQAGHRVACREPQREES